LSNARRGLACAIDGDAIDNARNTCDPFSAFNGNLTEVECWQSALKLNHPVLNAKPQRSVRREASLLQVRDQPLMQFAIYVFASRKILQCHQQVTSIALTSSFLSRTAVSLKSAFDILNLDVGQ